VLWVRDDLHISKVADVAEEDRTYLPVLAFFVPQDYALDGNAFTVTLSDSLIQLFGTQRVLSVYDASTGITYILPASNRDLFVRMEHTAQAERAARTDRTTHADAIPFVPKSTASTVAGTEEEPLGLGDADSILRLF
jgi:hypothetical protein